MNKAIIFLNMGAPRNLDEVELFLKNMFNDKNIITVKSDFLRKFISFMIVASRKNEAKKNYEKLGGISPLVKHTENFLQNAQKRFDEYFVTSIMRYTPPFAYETIKILKEKNIKEVILFPLYPQYSTTTTKSSLEDFFETAEKEKFNSKIHIVERFYKNKSYNQAIVDRIKESLANDHPSDFELIFSAHSLPQKIIDRGDSYQNEVLENIEILKKMLNENGIYFKNISVAYQSKLGPVKWLEPSLEDKLKILNSKRVIIYPISFILDNSETEFELDMEYRELANELNFEDYRVCKCINDSDLFLDCVEEVIDSK